MALERQHQSPFEASELTRSEPFPPGTTIARYRLVSCIGSGAMGDVYRAHDRALDREVALKVLPPELVGDRERVHRFAHEARATSALSHPHIVTIHEVGHARPLVSVRPIGERSPKGGEVHYISMELIDGQTLRETLAASLPLRQLVELLAQVAEGLAKAHSAGIIHRDLKPDNILVSRDGYAKIVDFGLAKLIDTSWNPIGADSPTLRALTAHGDILGTPGYMAPEQVTGTLLDARADIFSFGCILYEAIGGRRAFEAETFVDTLYKIIHEDPAPLVNAPYALQQIVARCLAKNREARYESIRDVAQELREWIAATAHAEAGPERRGDGKVLKLAAAAAVVAALPILAWVFLGGKPPAPAVPESGVRRITSDGRSSFATISHDGRYVAYITSDPQGRTVWLEQLATGRTLAVVPPSQGMYTGLTFSRDGEYLYFSRYDASHLGTLYRVSILGGEPQPLAKDVDSRPALSPDGKLLAYIRDNYNKGTTTLLVANADGTNERPLARLNLPDRLFWPAWSPDGEHVVAAQQAKLVVIGYPKGNTRTIATSVKFDGLRGVAWPERNRIVAAATTTETSGRFRLWRVDAATGASEPLTSELTDLHGPSVSETGALAALQVIRQANLFEVTTETANVQQLTTGIGASNGLSGVAWLGERVIYASSAADGKLDLWSRKPGGDAIRLTDDAQHEAYPRVTPDGSTVLYVSGDVDRQSIWRVNPDGTERKQVTAGPRDGSFAVSPDSKRLAYASLDPKSSEWVLWLMPLEGGAKTRVASRGSVLDHVTFSADGQTIFFAGYEKDQLQLYRVPAAGGAAVAMTGHRTSAPMLSPDGKTIAASYDYEDWTSTSLALIPTNGGEIRTLPLKAMMYQWHPGGKAISYVREDNGRHDLWLQPLDGGAPRKLTQFNEGSIMRYAWSADGSRAVVAHMFDSVDVVLMK